MKKHKLSIPAPVARPHLHPADRMAAAVHPMSPNANHPEFAAGATGVPIPNVAKPETSVAGMMPGKEPFIPPIEPVKPLQTIG